MPRSASPSIENLEETWRSVIDACTGLAENEWARPTGCPGWSVQDNVSHLVDFEARALGRPEPDGEAVARPHTKNPLGERNEVGVEHRRGRRGSDVLDELREVTAARSAQLRVLTAEDLRCEVATPDGRGTVADSLRLRVMDTWSHEQDIRRAVGRPGHVRGPAVDEVVAHFARSLPIVVVKRAGGPEGAVVVFEVGDVHRCAIEVIDGRGRFPDADADAGDWTVRLRMPTTTFGALVGGRSDAPDDVAIDGDVDLGRRIVGCLGVTP